VKADLEGDYNFTILSDHKNINTFVEWNLRGIATNGARIKALGMVKIEEKAAKTDSFLSMKILLLDDKSCA